MVLKALLTTKLSNVLGNINSIVEEIIRRSLIKNGYAPALAGTEHTLPSPGSSFDIKDILDKGFVWCPTPKHRTSAEKKLTKKFLPLPNNFITKYSRPKTNIITCLECGNHHERGTLCGKCYEKVKIETQKVHEEMFKNENFKKSHPAKEVKFLYEDDSRENLDQITKNELFVEIPNKRPSWFTSDLVTKVFSKAK
ncbi:unnamed protein product [Brachionus calyciflorus]|uniref:Mitochondrial ribosomal protein L32 n=1 Tax=Brachionus calyciflorus TaxID=104777 RepID=A0A814HXR3_9BILA|nr:unnamed protein product [Brachionus calyciflorus]